MKCGAFEIHEGATRGECAALAEGIWEGELKAACIEGIDRGLLGRAFWGLAGRSRTYVAEIDGRLAGICFVEDSGDRREMSFAKTQYLATERKITFARSIAALFRALRDLERGQGDGPMVFHVPDERSKAWFLKTCQGEISEKMSLMSL